MTKKELWLRLQSYHFEHIVPASMTGYISHVFSGKDASTRAFAHKIARKHNLGRRFVAKAIHEYKKFVYLGVISDFTVTPPMLIDIIWHEHLLFSKAYREFCSNVIEYTFDHNPELLPLAIQTGQYSAQYHDTLELYKTEFGSEPPADIWETTKYDKETVASGKHRSATKKDNSHFDGTNSYATDGPLVSSFEGTPGFNGFGGGDFGGGGATGGWDATDSNDGGDGGDGGGCSGGGD